MKAGAWAMVGAAAIAPVAAAAPQAEGDSVDAPSAALLDGPMVKGFANLRLRHEEVYREDIVDTASALTARLRLGAEVMLGGTTSLLGEVEAVADLARGGIEDREPGVLVGDRELLEINRAQFSHGWSKGRVVAGRQSFVFDDGRWVGSPDFRQNQQTHDAIRLSLSPYHGVALDLAYLAQVNRSKTSLETEETYRGDTILARLEVRTPAGLVSLYRHGMDLDDGDRLPTSQTNSNLTIGIGLDGRRSVGDLTLKWRGGYARQEDYAGNPLNYDAEYYRLEFAAEIDRFALGLDHERLGDGGVRAFQAPIGAKHGFQGAAGLFSVTPLGGLRDTNIEAQWRIGALGSLKGLGLTARRHWFDDDRNGERLGAEWDALVSGRLLGTQVSLEYAIYAAERFGADTERLWVTISRTF